MENTEDLFRIGVLTKPHGVKGEISVYPTTDDVQRFSFLEECYIIGTGNNKTPKKVTVEGCKYKKNQPVLKFKEYNSIEEVEQLRNMELFVDREHAIPLEEGEFYLSDTIGCRVIDSATGEFGVVEDYMTNLADQVIFIIKCDDGSTINIVNVPAFVTKVDIENKQIFVNRIKGM